MGAMEKMETKEEKIDSLPDMTLLDQAGPVAAPVAPGPPRALVEELDVVLERRLQLTFLLVLNPRLPLMADKPAAHKIVVVGLEDLTPPLLLHESLKKLVISEDFRSVGASSTRHARGTAVHVVRCRDLKIASLDIGGAQPVPYPEPKSSLPNPLYPLACADTSNLRVLKWGQNPRHHGRWPGNVVIGHNSDASRNLWQGLAHLDALIGVLSAEYADVGRREGFCNPLQILKLVGGCDHNQLVRLCGQNTLKRGSELIKVVVDRGNHNRNII